MNPLLYIVVVLIVGSVSLFALALATFALMAAATWAFGSRVKAAASDRLVAITLLGGMIALIGAFILSLVGVRP